jgi:hypothetical protein
MGRPMPSSVGRLALPDTTSIVASGRGTGNLPVSDKAVSQELAVFSDLTLANEI